MKEEIQTLAQDYYYAKVQIRPHMTRHDLLVLSVTPQPIELTVKEAMALAFDLIAYAFTFQRKKQ